MDLWFQPVYYALGIFLKGWGHFQLGTLFEREKWSCFVSRLQSVQILMRKWKSFSDHMPEINCFPEGHWTEGGWSAAFMKEEDCIWQQEEEEGREMVECQPGSGFIPRSNALEWHEAPNSCLLSMVTAQKQSLMGLEPFPKASIIQAPHFAFHFRCDWLSRDLDNQKIKEEEPGMK